MIKNCNRMQRRYCECLDIPKKISKENYITWCEELELTWIYISVQKKITVSNNKTKDTPFKKVARFGNTRHSKISNLVQLWSVIHKMLNFDPLKPHLISQPWIHSSRKLQHPHNSKSKNNIRHGIRKSQQLQQLRNW